MPREIKTTIAVDGEAAFKRAINEANTSIRNMGTQLTLATAQFQKDGDAMKLVESRSKTLKSEIQAQQEVVKALEKAVTDSSTAFGENSAKTEKWEAELNRAKAKLVNLENELTLNNAGLDRNGKAFDDSSQKAADYQATLQTVGKGISYENITNGIGKITSGFESAIRKIFSFAKAMRDTMVDAGHWADDLMTDATKYGVDVEELQRMRNAADFIDTDVETIVNARNKLAQKMNNGWTKTEGKNKIDLWELYGIKIHDGDTGKFRDEMDVLFDAGELLMSIAQNKDAGGEVRADAVAMELFGKSFRELLPLFSAGQDEWNRTMAEQRVVSKEHVEALGAMDDANNKLENSWETLKYTALAEIAPVMTDAANGLANLLNEFNDWIETDEGKEAMDGLAEALQELFSGLGDIKFKDAINTAKDGLNELKGGLNWLKENKDNVSTALIVIGAGFGALKVAGVAVNVGKIVKGFQTLWEGAKNPMPTLPGTGGGTGASGAAASSGSVGWGAALWAGAKAALPNLLAAIGIHEAAKLLPANLGTAAAKALGIETSDMETVDEINAAHGINTLGDVEAQVLKTPQEQNRRTMGFILDTLLHPGAGAEEHSGGGGSHGFGTPMEEITEDVNLDPVYTLAQKLDAAQDWWDAYRNAESGVDSDEEEANAYAHLQEALGEGFGDFWEAFIEQSDKTDMTKMEDLPESITDVISQNAGTLDEAVSQMRANVESGKTVADKVAGMDLKRFNGLPAEIQAAAQRGTASGVSGIVVRLDGAAVGRLVAPYVNSFLGYSMS